MSEMLSGMITEEELLKVMGVKKSDLAYLRKEKGLPFVKLNSRRRVYLEEDLMQWFREHRLVLDRDLSPEKVEEAKDKGKDADSNGINNQVPSKKRG